ncbi:tail fiber assembly protein [Enterobacter roggenkampii]|uniref:tail fiber assembly protein n=1 Tax=Enterobacter roggenkampii TaxID=1812935 RepID=UPI00254E4FB5|nr:tail fiber assembly protein [Enterobacter roggenkampii]MDK4549763.1 tail fiber assembly protein [Enterobacter roggenkampii]
MIKRYALIKDGVVENLVSWDGRGDLFSEFLTVELNDDSVASVGWSYDGKKFMPPPEPEKTHEELVAEADEEKHSRLDYAASKIVIWQTKLLMGRNLTTAETTSLNAWMDYIDAVTLIDTETAPDTIDWPLPPEV